MMVTGWKKITEVIDDGKLEKGGKVFTGDAKWVFIRSDDPQNIQVKNIQVRHLGGGGGARMPTQSAATMAYYAYYYPKIPISLSS